MTHTCIFVCIPRDAAATSCGVEFVYMRPGAFHAAVARFRLRPACRCLHVPSVFIHCDSLEYSTEIGHLN